MNIQTYLQKFTALLEEQSISTSRLECLVLLEDAVGKNRSWLLAHQDQELDDDIIALLEKQIMRRAKHEPLAYIRGKTEFYGREFMVNNHTLEPRPETEDMIDLLKGLPLTGKHIRVADIGTGSGAIGLTAALEIPNVELALTDIDAKCLETAQQNAKKHGVKAVVHKGNLLKPLLPFRPLPPVLLCNLPYVPDSHTINSAAMHEPKHAIFGGADGLDLYRELFLQIDSLEIKLPYVLTEALPFQHEALAAVAGASGYSLEKTVGFIQLFKP